MEIPLAAKAALFQFTFAQEIEITRALGKPDGALLCAAAGICSS
jgi:hypothetical protein